MLCYFKISIMYNSKSVILNTYITNKIIYTNLNSNKINNYIITIRTLR